MENIPNNLPISTLEQAQDFLNHHKIDYQICLEDSLEDLLQSEEEGIDFNSSINEKLEELFNICLPEASDSDGISEVLLKSSLHCVFFNKLYDVLMPSIYWQFAEQDKSFFNKSLELYDANVTAEQLGAPQDYSIPLLAAVVELTNLDNCRSPLEKLHCLCTTYDLIFAELKSAIINVISKFSDKETEIPVVNNSDALPILMTVIIKSKLVHLYSNFYFIETFLKFVNRKDNIGHVLKSFKEAINQIQCIDKQSLKPSSNQVFKDLDLVKFIHISNEVNIKLQQKSITPLDGHVLRVTDLIITSTNENHPTV